MFSSKNNPLKAITLTIASAMAASLFAGCSESVSEQNSTDIGEQSIAEVTSSVTSVVDSEPESVEILPIETAESMSDSQDTNEDVTENSDTQNVLNITEEATKEINDYDTNKPIEEQLPEDYTPANDDPLADAQVYEDPTSAELMGIDQSEPIENQPAETTFKQPVQTEPEEVSKPAKTTAASKPAQADPKEANKPADDASYKEWYEYYDS